MCVCVCVCVCVWLCQCRRLLIAWFALVLWHIYRCGYLMPNPVFNIYIYCMICELIL